MGLDSVSEKEASLLHACPVKDYMLNVAEINSIVQSLQIQLL